MLSDYFSLAFKNLKHRGIRSWLTLLGIFIGVMAVVALIGLGTGLKTAINSQFGVSSTELITIQAGGVAYAGPPGTGAVVPITTDELRVVKNVNNVELAIGRNIGSVKVEFSDGTVSFVLAGSLPEPKEEREFIYETFGAEIMEGFLLNGGETSEVVLGYGYSNDALDGDGVEVGDKIELNGKIFKVKGIFGKTGSFVMDYLIIVNEKPLRDLIDSGDELSLIVVKMKDKELIDNTKLDIEKALRRSRNVDVGDEDFVVSTPAAAMKTVNSILTGIQIFIVIIAFISVFIGTIGIINTMGTSVVERKKEIGIMKSIGARNRDVFYQFFIEAGLLGLVGGLVGVVCGTLISVLGVYGINYQFGTDLVPDIDFFLISFSLLGSFSIGAIAGIVPAMNAARQNPVDALRG
jgi:putative ABC transport system permease protein